MVLFLAEFDFANRVHLWGYHLAPVLTKRFFDFIVNFLRGLLLLMDSFHEYVDLVFTFGHQIDSNLPRFELDLCDWLALHGLLGCHLLSHLASSNSPRIDASS